MQKLVNGAQTYQSRVFAPQREHFQRLAKAQSPEALFITCSDSRIDPNLLTQAAPGELFTVRNAGNIVPPYGAPHSGEAATIEYAVTVLKVRDVVVCGHSHCGAIQALLNPQLCSSLRALSSWLRHAERARELVATLADHNDEPDQVLTAAQANVLVQLENLQTHPWVQRALNREQLRLHAWLYRLDTGEVTTFDPALGRFIPLTALAIGQPVQARLA